MSIVLVDDDATALAVLKRFIKKFRPDEPVTFTNPLTALEYLAKNSAELVIVDYSMPEMNGIDVITAVRAGTANATIPIVMLTSAAFDSVKAKARIAGASEFLTKPVDASQIKTRALDLIGKPHSPL